MLGTNFALTEDAGLDFRPGAESIAARSVLFVDDADRTEPAVPTVCLGGALSRLRTDIVGTCIPAATFTLGVSIVSGSCGIVAVDTDEGMSAASTAWIGELSIGVAKWPGCNDIRLGWMRPCSKVAEAVVCRS